MASVSQIIVSTHLSLVDHRERTSHAVTINLYPPRIYFCIVSALKDELNLYMLRCLEEPRMMFIYINSLAPGKFEWNFRYLIIQIISVIDGWGSLVNLPLDECHSNLLMISQHWFRYWLGAVRPQAITWANIDPDLCHIASLSPNELTHWGWVMHRCVSELTIIESDNGLLSGRRQAIIWTNSGILIIRTLGTNFSKT